MSFIAFLPFVVLPDLADGPSRVGPYLPFVVADRMDVVPNLKSRSVHDLKRVQKGCWRFDFQESQIGGVVYFRRDNLRMQGPF